MALSKNTVDDFIFETVLIKPIVKILNQLNKNEFRDCDIKWLDERLGGFVKFAAETLGIKNIISVERGKFPFMNPYVQNYYIERFKKLLDYFNSFK